MGIMSVVKEFKEFALKGNMIDLAVAVVIGGAFGKVVSAVVADLIMPVVGVLLPGGAWRTYTATPLKLQVGDFLGAVIDFLIVALVMFVVVVKVMGALRKPDAPAAPTTRPCPECLETIPIAARRCRACTATVAA
jgi:large conductance mechanosensitive channel